MTDRVRILEFDWNDANGAHIASHGVDVSEAEETLLARPYLRRGRGGRYLAYGPTADGRWLFVVFVLRPRGVARVVTARDMTLHERRAYRRRSR